MAEEIRLLYVLRPAEGGMREHLRLLLFHLPPEFRVDLAGAADEGLIALARERGGRYHPLPIKAALDPRSDLQAALALTRLLKAERFHLVHAHGFKASLPARLACRWAAGRAIYTCHNFVRPDWQGWRRHLYLKLERHLARHTEAIIAVSRAMRDCLVREAGLPADRVVVIPNGISIERFQHPRGQAATAPPWQPPRRPFILCVARLIPAKGVQHLLQAVHLLHSSRRLPSFHLAVAGDGPQRAALEELAKELALEERVTFLGPRSDVPALLAQADLFVLPSLSEGAPLSVLEAMAAGCPVVATAVGGVTEVIQNGITGYLAPLGDPSGLAECLLAALADPREAKARAERAQQLVKSEYSAEAMVQRTADLYRAVLKKERSYAQS
ncbi:MAG: glycosyltransferase family 4 protein [Bacillota bacterium]|nr:glycosyltransferase family 4 protein [Bacillota bacterium]